MPTHLRQHQLKLRFSDNVVPGSVIFPLSGVAFLLVPLSKATKRCSQTNELQITKELEERVDRLTQVHKKCFVLCMAPLHGDQQRQVYSLIQRKYIDTQLGMLPVHNTNEAVKTMLTISKALCKPTSELVNDRLQSVVEDQLQTGYMAAALRQFGLESHENHLVVDGLGSLAKLATVSPQELLDCSLQSSTVNKIGAFFNHM